MKKGAIIGGNSTDYVFSNECCDMVDVMIDCKAQVHLNLSSKVIY